ncbi:hypothetical protein SCMU_19310 [Sinomonas cyclohexanicum]|uniref:Uncharacterized protein n=1 Tax=Sinomonas cyclohexanicum TaxID=322009 RepID=A0ABM7PVG9_SINCY|nr:hypothetical protein [Corynebacterium cyclohexanicum]BCT76089.1 hypothetical protein SCMU_19310 [Corynebacterium cyclohexanicum]
MPADRDSQAVPADWPEPPWLKVFNRRELAWLAHRLDATNRELRITIQRLRAELDKEPQA